MDIIDTDEEISGPSTIDICASNDDTEFCSFYYKAIKQLIDIDNGTNISILRRYFKIFNEYYDVWCQVKPGLKKQENTIINLLEDSLYFRIAYIYGNATLLSSAVAFHFRNVYKQSRTYIKRLITKKLVKICSFGGCSVSDIVAIVTVFESIALKHGIELDFRVTIIESDERWKITCITILSCLQQFHEATWKITFIEGTLKKNSWTPVTIKAIQEADVVTIIRLLSKFRNTKKIMKEICYKLQPRAVLFFLDRPLKPLIETSFYINVLEDFELIHEESCDLHTLDIEAVHHFKNLYQKHFGNQEYFEVNISFSVFISVWIKTSPKLAINFQDNNECILQKSAEKYNPKQSFLSTNAFFRWKSLFTKQKEVAGWNAKRIGRFVQREKVKRNRLLVKFIDQKKKLDTLQNNVLNKVQSIQKEGEEANETTLNSYLIQKRQYSFMKKTVYYSSLRPNICLVESMKS